MNHDQWKKLSYKQRRIKVAKLRGYCVKKSAFFITNPEYGYQLVYPNGLRSSAAFGSEDEVWRMCSSEYPDYLFDLNAMHEVWTACIEPNDTLIEQFALKLERVCRVEWRENNKSITWFFGKLDNATAAQRAEAFVLTMEPE